MGVHGFLYSQIGYDLRDPKRAMIRRDEKGNPSEPIALVVLEHRTLKPVLRKEAVYWGEKWGSHWWRLDFSEVDTAGQYILQAFEGANLLYQSDIIEMDRWLLWDKTLPDVLFTQFEVREKLARNENGWKDCGSEWREVSSICGGIIGLTDVLDKASALFSTEETRRIVNQLIVSCDYLALCQDRAVGLQYPKGAITHELPGHLEVIPGDILQSAVSLARTSRLIYEHNPEKGLDYLARAESAYLYFQNNCQPYGGDGFSAANHGAPADFIVPEVYMTRDLLMQLWAAYELYVSGKKMYKDDIFSIARQVMARQIPKEKAEGGLYGHFYTFGEAYGISEKCNVHHHVGHDTGAVFPHYLVPLMQVCSHFYQHADVPLWRQCIADFAYGYFLPACEANPFTLMPVGYFQNEGLLDFCGPWHGINVSYAYAASLAMCLEGFLGDRRFRNIAVAQLQWIAGLNSGITRQSFAGCVLWTEDIPEDVAVSMSQIEGIGNRCVKVWSGIKGAIANGFSANIQFTFGTAPTADNDKPIYYCDEDWVPHAGGWISALAHLYERKRYAK